MTKKKKPEYTIAVHIKLLKKMLKKDVCALCPAGKRFRPFTVLYDRWSSSPCRICQEFVGIPGIGCPCCILGEEEAIRRTLLAIEEYEEGD